MDYQPIWKDYYFNLTETTDYEVYQGVPGASNTKLIYSGRACLPPGETQMRVKINNIVAPYLSQNYKGLYAPYGVELNTNAAGVFTVMSASTLLAQVFFYDDQSYTNDYQYGNTNTPAGTTAPISYEVAAWQKVFISNYLVNDTSQQLAFSWYRADGRVWKRLTQNPGRSYVTNHTIDEEEKSVALRIEVASDPSLFVEYRLAENVCPRYALYYFNAFGGADSLLLKGEVMKSDAVTRKAYDTTYNNALTRGVRGSVNYRNVMIRNWTFNTGWLEDWQAARMFHLLESTIVLLHDYLENKYIFLNLTNKTAEYKTYQNSGRKLINYTITAEETVKYERR